MKRRRLGQHYLVDDGVVSRVVSLADVKPSEKVLEIGTGRGILSRELAGTGASFVGFEIDRENFETTKKAVKGKGAKITHADAFDQSPEFDVLVSSLPYSESAVFIQWLSGLKFDRAVVIVQEDFARKLLAPPGDRNYRGVSALAQIAFNLEIVEKVPRRAFSPEPRVSSVIVKISSRRIVSKDEAVRVVKLFTLRRRQADSALAELGMKKGAGFGDRRVYSLSPEEVHELCAG